MSATLNHSAFTHSLWRQCEQLYAQKPTAYILLQDTYQINVNLLLLAQYLDQQTYLLSETQWQIMLTVIAKWEESVLQPYRKLRRIAKGYLADEEYQKMLEVELIMERRSQHLLLQKLNLLNGLKCNSSNSDTSNIQHYLNLLALDKSIMATLNT